MVESKKISRREDGDLPAEWDGKQCFPPPFCAIIISHFCRIINRYFRLLHTFLLILSGGDQDGEKLRPAAA